VTTGTCTAAVPVPVLVLVLVSGKREWRADHTHKVLDRADPMGPGCGPATQMDGWQSPGPLPAT
jgi:hypothetical protein